MADYFGKDGSLNMDQHKQVRCDPDFMPKFRLSDILEHPEIAKGMESWSTESVEDEVKRTGFNLDGVEISREIHPIQSIKMAYDAIKRVREVERDWNTNRGIDNVNRFDSIANDNWKRLMPPGTVPELMIQHRARKRVLMDMRVPSLRQDFFYRDYDIFKDVCSSSMKELNDTCGDILSGDYTQYIFEPVAVMTDYCGTINGEDASFTMDPEYLKLILSEQATGNGIISHAEAHNNRLVNFISVVFKNSILKYQNYPQLSLREPYESDISYIRHTFLFKGVS